MSGNVWEWTVSLYEKRYPYIHDGEWNNETAGDDSARVVRGGAFPTSTTACVAPTGQGAIPTTATGTSGFVARSLPIRLRALETLGSGALEALDL
jgi:formylglycine-generating enzyme required for sulfatase activity